MKEGLFEINNRFVVDQHKNEVRDKEKNQLTRLEPRLMKLLCLLVNHSGELVTREYIVKEIWNEYPGANESLNQAISFLRKQLADDGKEIIKTLPKAGYSLHASIVWDPEKVPVKKSEFKWTRLIQFGFPSLLLLFLFYTNKKNANTSPQELNIKRDAEISRLDSIHQAEAMKQYKDK